ncbi:hypothetical protein GY45DRAFT_1287086 [Cubamyces sp. BRFM 1775]|nr:hypothetical protein GY45DRAFT_1287086 [Cubamyces sp. BRFM 1775]
MDQGEEPRVKGKGKGKEIVVRYAGEVIEGEHEAVIRDPRKEPKIRKLPPLRPLRTELLPCKYEYDANSAGPPPPASVLILGISPLMPNQHIRRHFGVHGTITSFEPQIDKSSGGALGIVFIRYTTHEEAKKCVQSEHGKKLSLAVPGVGDGEELRVVFDGEGRLLKAVLAELDDRRRKEREEKRRREKEEKEKAGQASSHLKATPTSSASHTPVHANNPWRSGLQAIPRPQHLSSRPPPPTAGLPMRPQGATPMAISPVPDKGSPLPNATPAGPRNGPAAPARVRRAPPALSRGRNVHAIKAIPPSNIRPPIHLFPNGIAGGPVLPPSLRLGFDERDMPLPLLPSRSPSPVSRRPGQWGRNTKKVDYDVVKAELAKNGFEHIAIDGHVGSVREDEVRNFLEGFEIDQILRDRHSWYVTFKASDTARRASFVLNTSGRKLANYSVTVTVRAAPTHVPTAHKTQWTDAELIEQAQKTVLRDLRALLEKDVVERVVASQVRRVITDHRSKKTARTTEAIATVNGHVPESQDVLDAKLLDKTGLRGLSFRKQKKRPLEEVAIVSTETPAMSEKADDEGEEEVVVERPKKKPKKAVPKKVVEEKIIESEDEDIVVQVPDVPQPRKRALSEVSELDVPVKKKAKTQLENGATLPARSKKSKKALKDALVATPDAIVIDNEVVHEVLPETLPYEPPSLAQVRITPGFDSRPSTPASPVLPSAPEMVATEVPTIDPIAEGICDDEEEMYFAKLALERSLFGKSMDLEHEPEPEAEGPSPFRKHVTGSARTEGYYKISHAEKSAYVAQYVSRGVLNTAAVEAEQAPPQPAVTSSRSNRANARRRAQGLEEINQVQRAMALSKGEAAAPDSVKYNQLQTRKKHLRFARSPIHDWGLYAMEKISRGEMVIEYVGEVIRAQVADKREKAYERQGIGSSYLFRIDEDLVVDATKKGNLGRLINHSCDPNCTAKIITISGEKKIVIYAKQDIELGSEITYDYHFPIEQDKIPCLCGSAKCRGTLN